MSGPTTESYSAVLAFPETEALGAGRWFELCWRNEKMGARILIVDDHEIFRRGLRSLLESRADWEVCGEATDGQDGVEKAKQLQPDVVVLDITMPRLNGLDATAVIRKEVPNTRVVILSQHQPALMKQVALTAGAGAYVTKSEVSRELMAAIDGLLSNDPGRAST